MPARALFPSSASLRGVRAQVTILLAALLTAQVLALDVVRLKNGTVIEGEVIGCKNDTIYVRTADVVRGVPNSQVADIQRDQATPPQTPPAVPQPSRPAPKPPRPQRVGPRHRPWLPPQPGWIHLGIADTHLGWPYVFTADVLKCSVGLPSPFSLGIGTEIIGATGTAEDGPELWQLFPLTFYYAPYVRRTDDGRAMPAVYAYFTINPWYARVVGSAEVHSQLLRLGAGAQVEVWRGWNMDDSDDPNHGLNAVCCCLTSGLTLAPAAIGLEVGWMRYRYLGITRSSAFVDFTLSFGWHWRALASMLK